MLLFIAGFLVLAVFIPVLIISWDKLSIWYLITFVDSLLEKFDPSDRAIEARYVPQPDEEFCCPIRATDFVPLPPITCTMSSSDEYLNFYKAATGKTQNICQHAKFVEGDKVRFLNKPKDFGDGYTQEMEKYDGEQLEILSVFQEAYKYSYYTKECGWWFAEEWLVPCNKDGYTEEIVKISTRTEIQLRNNGQLVYKLIIEDGKTHKYWLDNNLLHRENGPASISKDFIGWYKHGKLHRLDGPAIERANGDKFWYKEGQLHRLDGPAIEYATGDKCWYKEDKRHRLDGPATELANGTKWWYKEGKLHREDGPACEYANGDKSWYKEGIKGSAHASTKVF